MALPTRVNRNLPSDPLDAVQQEFEGVLNRMLGGRMNNAGTRYAPYGVDIREDADHLYVEAELPGFKKEEIDITMENQTLTISAERREQQKDQKKGDVLLNERRYTSFLRSFTLPQTVDDQKVDAKLQDGVLTIKLNKREETKPRKISVQ
jgi:HSP20 family protein